MEMKFCTVKKILKIQLNFKRKKYLIMDEQLRIILIIIIFVSIFGLLVFVFVRNYIKNKIKILLKKKNKKLK